VDIKNAQRVLGDSPFNIWRHLLLEVDRERMEKAGIYIMLTNAGVEENVVDEGERRGEGGGGGGEGERRGEGGEGGQSGQGRGDYGGARRRTRTRRAHQILYASSWYERMTGYVVEKSHFIVITFSVPVY
jgi:hypothetical protein